MTRTKGLSDNDERLAKNAGWNQIPECGFVVKGEEDRLHCTYRYDSERLILSKAVSAQVVEERYNTTVRECSVKFCPFKIYLGV